MDDITNISNIMNINVGVDTQIMTSDGYIKKIQDIKSKHAAMINVKMEVFAVFV